MANFGTASKPIAMIKARAMSAITMYTISAAKSGNINDWKNIYNYKWLKKKMIIKPYMLIKGPGGQLSAASQPIY